MREQATNKPRYSPKAITTKKAFQKNVKGYFKQNKVNSDRQKRTKSSGNKNCQNYHSEMLHLRMTINLSVHHLLIKTLMLDALIPPRRINSSFLG